MTDKAAEIEVREKQEVDESQGEPTWEGVFFTPEVDIYADENSITVLADLPGVNQDNLEIDLREGALTLVGRPTEIPEKYHPTHEECKIGGYTRRFTLSDDIDVDKVSATLRDGVLELTLPKAEKAIPRKIEVKVG